MSYISQISPDNGTTVYKLASGLYGICTVGQATVNKTVQCADFNALVTGVTIHVKMSAANTATNPTLDVNGTGAIAIMRYGATHPSTSAATSWNAGSVVSFTYDGTYWQMNDWRNDNTTYSAMSVSEGQTGTATSSRVVRADYLRQIAGSWSYPVLTSLTSGATLVWNREYRLGSISALNFVIPAIRTYDSNEIRVVFTAGSNINASITAPSGVTLYGMSDVSISSGKVYELSIAVIGTAAVSVICKEWS